MSQINYIDIDGDFPKAGIDNSSQGFRDNYTIIKNSLQTAKEEITELETITAKTNQSNDFNKNSITSLVVGNWAQKAYNRTVAAENFQIVDIGLIPSEDVPTNTSAGGNYQQFFLEQNTTFNLQGWYSPGYCSLRVAVYLENTVGSYAINFTSSAPGGNGTIHYDRSSQLVDASEWSGARGYSLDAIVKYQDRVYICVDPYESQVGGYQFAEVESKWQIYDKMFNWSQFLTVSRSSEDPTRVFKIYEFWSIDGGSNVFCKFLGRYTAS